MNGLLRNLAVYGESVSLYEPELQKSVGMRVKGDFHLFKRRGRKISGECKRHHSVSFSSGLAFGSKPFTQIGGVKQIFGGVDHFIRGVREILGGV